MKYTKPKGPVIFVKASEQLVERLRLASTLTDRNMSDLTREAIREKLARLAKEYPQLSAA